MNRASVSSTAVVLSLDEVGDRYVITRVLAEVLIRVGRAGDGRYQ